MLRAEHPAAAAPSGEPEPLRVTNLLCDVETLGRLLAEAAATGGVLDAFLLAAGINQIAEDHLHDSAYPIDDAVPLLQGSGSSVARAGGRVLAEGALAIRRARSHSAGVRQTSGFQGRIARLVDALADALITGSTLTPELAEQIVMAGTEIAGLAPPVARSVIRLPACFHDFDQRPEDVEWLAERYAERALHRDRPVLALGVRTSGSYLAPLLAGALRVRGFTGAQTMTIRPHRPLLAREQVLVRSVLAAEGRVLLIDDPPVTGSSLATAAQELHRLGVPRPQIVMMFGLHDDLDGPPRSLSEYETVVLPWARWHVRRQLDPDAVAAAITELMEDELAQPSVQELEAPGSGGRHSHACARVRVRGVNRTDGRPRETDVLATAVGVGYLGAHQLAVAEALPEFTPRVLGLRDGVLYREWVPAARQIQEHSPELPPAVAAYVEARRRGLPVPRDVSVDMYGQRPVWEVAALVLGRNFSRAAPVARVALVQRAVRRLLDVERPSVVDGAMGAGHWFARGRSGSAIKVAMSDHTYRSRGLVCFDAQFDLAGAGVLAEDADLPRRIRAAWLERTGEPVDPEAWLLYELAHLWGWEREDPGHEASARRLSARAVARYFADAFLADLSPDPTGPVCALDIDGVLETQQLGFPTLTRASATALRALIAHGYRPVPVTGRGLDEVRDRCRVYGLAGGVAEYGATVCFHGGERSRTLVDSESAALLRRLRFALRGLDGVRIDPAFHAAVRAYRIGSDGARRPLGSGEVDACLSRLGAGAALRSVGGESQTDFVPSRVDKGSGVAALLNALGAPGLALAVGDSAEDAPMLGVAGMAFAPGHCTPGTITTGATRLRAPYQAGFARAVESLLRHPAGGCPRCRVPPMSERRELLLDLLSLPEAGPRSLAGGALHVARRIR